MAPSKSKKRKSEGSPLKEIASNEEKSTSISSMLQSIRKETELPPCDVASSSLSEDNEVVQQSPMKVSPRMKADRKGRKRAAEEPPEDTSSQRRLLIGPLTVGGSAEEFCAFLSRRGHGFKSLRVTTRPCALLDLPQDEAGAEKLFASIGQLGGVTLMADGDAGPWVDGLVRDRTRLDIGNLHKDVTEADIGRLIPADCHVSSVTMLEGYKNKFRSAATAKFQSERDAVRALEALTSQELKGLRLHVYFHAAKEGEMEGKFTKTKKRSTNEDLRGKTRTFLIQDLPARANFKVLKDQFVGAIRLEVKVMGGQRQCFVECATEEACANLLDARQGAVFAGGRVHLIFVPQRIGRRSTTDQADGQDLDGPVGKRLRLFNLPFAFDEEHIRKEFPAALRVLIPKKEKSKPKGICILEFPSEVDCRAAIEECQEKTIKGRKIRFEILGKGPQKSHKSTSSTKVEDSPSEIIPESSSIVTKKEKKSKSKTAQKNVAVEAETEGSKTVKVSKKNKKSTTKVVQTNNTNSAKGVPDPGFVLHVFNLPYSAKVTQLKEQFPKVKDLQIPKGDDGKPKGMAVMRFQSEEECREAFQACRRVQLDGRKLRGEIQFQKEKERKQPKGEKQRHSIDDE